MPILRPLMQQGEYLSGQNNKILVRAEPATLQAITRIIKDLDRRLANLLITVSYDSQAQQTSTEFEANIKPDDRSNTTAPDSLHQSSTGWLQTDITATHFSTADRNRTEETIQVTEGFEAIFASQQQLAGINYPVSPFQQLQPRLSTRRANSGFSVIARLNDHSVNLRITPQQQIFSPDSRLQGLRLNTTLTIPLGEWVEIASNLSTAVDSRQSLLSRTDRRHKQPVSIKIRVDTVEQTH